MSTAPRKPCDEGLIKGDEYLNKASFLIQSEPMVFFRILFDKADTCAENWSKVALLNGMCPEYASEAFH